MSWQERAACDGMETDLFYPAGQNFAGLARAREICAGCPVAAECARESLDHREEHGVWGGLSERQRRRALRRQVA